MKYPWIDEYLLKKTGVTKDHQFDWNWIRYKIGGKMFCAICLSRETGAPYYITLKLLPAEGDLLRQQFSDIVPGFYCNKQHWNSIKPDGDVPDALMHEMLDKSYLLVLGSFSRKKQRELIQTTYCGLDCTSCAFRESHDCHGCVATGGMPFHCAAEPCPIAECSIAKNLSFCGECPDMPCALLTQYSCDPDHGDTPPGNRIESCRCINSLLRR